MHVAHDVSELAWTTIDETITQLAKQKGALDAEIGRWLLIAHRERIERKVGFGSFAEYVERRLGYDARTTHERLRVARALEELPRLDALLRAGQRSWSTVRELTRVATPETEAAWVAASERMTVRQVEAMVTGREPGAKPGDAPDPLLTTQRLVVELSPEELAEWQEAAEHVRREIGPAASNREVLRAMFQKELGQRADAQPGYQTAVTLCIGCERAWQRAGGEVVEVPAAVGDCARCDGEVVGVAHVDEGGATAHVGTHDIHSPESITHHDDPTARAGTHDIHSPESIDDDHDDDDDYDRTAHVGTHDIRQPDSAAHVGTDDPDAPAAHVGTHEHDADDRTLASVLHRLTARRGSRVLTRILSQVIGAPRTVTPKLRSAVRARDQGRCVVPGCNHFRFLDLHHQQTRATGGPNTLDNIVSLCTQHHRRVHDGVLAIEGSPTTGWVFRHAGGALYGAPRAPASTA